MTGFAAPRCAGLILAGGRGARLQHIIKANLLLGGQRYLDRVAARLSACRPLLVATGPYGPDRLPLPPGLLAIPDPGPAFAGPVAGLAAAVAFLACRAPDTRFLLTAAVDAPCLPADFYPRLSASIGDRPAAFAASAGQPHPTHALWRLDALAGLPAALAAGTAPTSLRRLAADPVLVDWPVGPAGDPFTNANTPEDLLLLARRDINSR